MTGNSSFPRDLLHLEASLSSAVATENDPLNQLSTYTFLTGIKDDAATYDTFSLLPIFVVAMTFHSPHFLCPTSLDIA